MALSLVFVSCDDGSLESVKGLTDKLAWLETNAESNGSYTLEVSANESITPRTLEYSGKNNITITLKGVGSNRILSLSSNEVAMFTVGSGVTLVLDNITLRSQDSSSAKVETDGTLIMIAGSTITGNDIFSGGGVNVSGGTFTMNGGTISGNNGGGVNVFGGTFTMNGGTISGNNGFGGGGVYVAAGGTFTMNDGTISGNNGFGGGVKMSGGTFTMNGGTISGNTASGSPGGGGVYVATRGTFTKTGGTVYGYSAGDTVKSNTVKDSSGNIVNDQGHAVYVQTWDQSSYSYLIKRKETTAGPSVNLSYNYDYNDGSPIFNGAWDN